MSKRAMAEIQHPRWSRPGCPELVAGSGKQVEVVVMGLTTYRMYLRIGHVVVVGSPYHMYPPPNGDVLVASRKKRAKQCKKRVAQKNM
jgi:hypothetical protein